MTIWIIEDDVAHASDAWRQIKSLVAEMEALARRRKGVAMEQITPAKLFWDQSMTWKPRLKSLDYDDVVPSEASSQLPDIVVLDLFRGDEFVAPALLRSLREWEREEKRDPVRFSHVILWSAYPGRPDALNFVRGEPKRDKHIVPMETKDEMQLRTNVAHCWRAREEELYP
ncbi:MAG: hypothetical protein LAO78_09385 [Acidobacteriia bacterium]|nr:hypothetical protein [Terriglobia bacterium]